MYIMCHSGRTQDWANTMAINVLGTVQGQEDQHGEFQLQTFQSFDNSVEPLSISFLFEKDRWKNMWEFTKARVTSFCSMCSGVFTFA